MHNRERLGSSWLSGQPADKGRSDVRRSVGEESVLTAKEARHRLGSFGNHGPKESRETLTPW